MQNTIFRTNLFRMDSFDSWTCPLGEEKKGRKNSTAQHGTVLSKFIVLLRDGFEINTTMLCKKPFSELTYFELKVLIAGRVPLKRQEKKSVQPHSREQCRANSELSFELSLKLSLQWLCKIPFSEITYFELKVLIAGCVPLERQKKNLFNRAAGNSAEQIQSYLLNWVRNYHYNDCAKYHFQN